LAEDLLGRGIDDVEEFSALRVNILAVDEELA
jgi:hypothetical protein